MEFISKSATITGDQDQFRWELGRRWGYGDGVLTFVMLNPSSADAMLEDNTIRRCIGFADCAGYSGINVVNLFPYRTRSPKKLHAWTKTLSPAERMSFRMRSERYAEMHARDQGDIVLAWGGHGALYPLETKAIIEAVCAVSRRVFHLGTLTDQGQPRHPLYLPSSSPWNLYA